MEKIPTIENKKNSFFITKLEKLKNLKEEVRKDFLILIAVSASLVASTESAQAQNQGVDTNKTEIYKDMEKEFGLQKDFLVNWFKDRIIEDEEFNRKFDGDRENVLKRLEKVFLAETSSWNGWRNDTVFVNPEDFQKSEEKTIIIHELSHDAFPANYGEQPKKELTESMPSWMVELIKRSIEISGDSGLEKVAVFKKYYQRPEEVYARICALRQKYSLNPKQKVSKEVMDKIIKENNENKNDSNIGALLMTISDEGQLLYLLNNLP